MAIKKPSTFVSQKFVTGFSFELFFVVCKLNVTFFIAFFRALKAFQESRRRKEGRSLCDCTAQ